MNIQALMKQAQKLQKQMTETKKEIDEKVFTGESSLVKIEMTGKREIKKVKITMDEIGKEDIEILEDMFLIATNDVLKKIETEIETKMGSHAQGLPGVF